MTDVRAQPVRDLTAVRGEVSPSRAVVLLSAAVVLLGTVAAAGGLFWSGTAATTVVTTVHGEEVRLFGEGLYRHDSVFRAAGNRGSDLVTLLVGVPLLLAALRSYRGRSLRGALAVAGMLTWFVYLSASLALGTAYNEMFLVYVATLSTGSFALVLLVRSLDVSAVAPEVLGRLPRRTLAALMLASGTLTAFVWLEPILTSLVTGDPPRFLMHSTTMVTEVLDLAVITPAAILAGVLLLRGRSEGYLVAFPLLALLWMMALAIVAQTVFQVRAGWEFTTAELVGPISGFLVLGTAATWLGLIVLRYLGPVHRAQ